MDSFNLSAAVVALWRVFLRLVKGCIVRAAWGDWTAPDTASRLFRRRQQGYSEAQFAVSLFGGFVALAWLAETLVRWLA